ncbi:MAG: hypothetical protein AB7N76_29275 [Planctomycetota bacterium]
MKPELPELERTSVTLPWASFRALLPRPQDDAAPAPPLPHALGRAEYEVELSPDHARVRARFELTALARDGWLTVPLLRPDEVALVEAALDGAPLSLVLGGGWLSLSLPAAEARGQRRVELTFLAKLEGPSPQARGLAFSTPRTPVTRLVVRGVRRDVLVSARPGFGLTLREEEGGALVARAALPPTERVELSWRPAAERAEPRRASLVGGSVDTRISVGERALSVAARVALQVSGGPAAGTELLLPAGFVLHSVTGEVVRDARPQDDRLRVRFAYDLLGEASFVVRGEVPLDPEREAVEAPVLALEAGPRARGTVAVDADLRVEVELLRVSGAARVDPSELGWNPDRSPTLLALKFVRARPAIELALRRHKDAPVLVATCDHTHLRALLLEDGKVFVKAHLLVRNNARSFLELRLPPGAELWSAYCGGQPARPSARMDGQGGVALIPLLTGNEDAFAGAEVELRSTTPLASRGQSLGAARPETDRAFEVELAYFLQRAPLGEAGRVELPLPGLDLPQTYVSLALFLPTGYCHFNFEGGLARTERFGRGFVPPAAVQALPVFTNVMQAQSFNAPARGPGSSLGGGGGRGGGGGGLGGEGQLPIRLPCLERGAEHRFEKTMVAGPVAPVAWEYKQRRRRR